MREIRSAGAGCEIVAREDEPGVDGSNLVWVIDDEVYFLFDIGRGLVGFEFYVEV